MKFDLLYFMTVLLGLLWAYQNGLYSDRIGIYTKKCSKIEIKLFNHIQKLIITIRTR